MAASDVASIVPASEMLAGAHLPTLDPGTMDDAELRRALGDGPRCEFRYTSTGKPVLALAMQPSAAADNGVVKLNGDLVMLDVASEEGDLLLTADPVRLSISLDGENRTDLGDAARRSEATLIFQVGDRLRVGYRGYYGCRG